MALDGGSGATIISVPTGYASSFDRNMSAATRQRLYDDGYAVTNAAIQAPQGCVCATRPEAAGCQFGSQVVPTCFTSSRG